MSAVADVPAPRDWQEFGRAVSHGLMRPGWLCRGCGAPLERASTVPWLLVFCPVCDVVARR